MNGPTRHTPSVWEPEPLQLPLEPSQRRTRRPHTGIDAIDPAIDDEARPEVDRPGSHVTVIDIS